MVSNEANKQEEFYNLSKENRLIAVNKVVPYLPAKCKTMMAKVCFGGL